MANPDQLLSCREGAALLQISLPTWWRHVKNGTIPRPIKIGRLSRWRRSDIAAVIAKAEADRDGEDAE